MTALPTSLRRTLLVLLAVMVSMIIMVFYWNQNSLKPVAFMNTIFTKNDRKNLLEKSWTYRCVGEKCIREHYYPSSGDKRIPFMSCAMICGEPHVWPMPTNRTTLSRQSLTFNSNQLNIGVVTTFSEAKRLLLQAYEIFLYDLKLLEEKDTENDYAKSELSNTDKKSRSYDNVSEWSRAKHCDIKQINIKVEISTIAEVYNHLDMDESYELDITNSAGIVSVHISAKSFFGARNGLSTLQQIIWYDDEDNLLRILSSAYIIDSPKFKYRGLMVDTSRNYFSVESVKRILIGMAHSKLNRFHWHITDSQSFPYVSKSYPQLAETGAYSSKEVYTIDDIKEITEFAKVRGIQVIPEIDSPAHAGNGWDWGPKHGLGELSLCINQQPWNFYCGEPPCGQLNPKNNNTYMVLQKLYEELLEATGPTDFFHIGGDEVNLECWAQFFNDTDLKGLWCDFMLQAYQRLKIANNNIAPKVVAVWSSGLTNTQCLSRHNFAVQVWGGSTWQENYDLIMNGFNVIISHVDAWYLDCGFGSWRMTGDGACSPYTTWQHMYKHRPWERMRLEPSKVKQILGGEACLWTEQVDESNLDSRLWPRVGAFAERLWSDPVDEHDIEVIPKDVFSRLSVFRNRLIQFGLKAEPLFPKYCAQNQEECV